jgi:hypothetical protein
LNVQPSRLTDILCHREQRYVGAQLTLSYERRQIILERNNVTEELAGKYVELYDYPDRLMEVRWKGVSLPYRVFSKDQRVRHTAIVEKKRLGQTPCKDLKITSLPGRCNSTGPSSRARSNSNGSGLPQWPVDPKSGQ